MDLLNKWYTVCGTRCRGSLSVCVNETLGLWTGTPVRNLGAKLKEALTPVLTLHLNDPENERFLKFWPYASYLPQSCPGPAEADCTLARECF